MAKNNNKSDSSGNSKQASDKKKKKGSGGLIFIILLFLIIGSLAAVIFLNPFGIRDNYLSGIISKIPVLNTMFPTTSDGSEPQVNQKSSREYEAEIAELTAQVDNLTEMLEQETAKSELYVVEIARLREFEEQQVQFREDKNAFDRMIAENDPKAYSEFYEKISPENAEILYRETIISEAQSRELKSYVSTVTSMDESAAAKMLEQMLPEDMNLVVLVLKNIDNDTSGAILGAMSAQNAASVYKQMSPEDAT